LDVAFGVYGGKKICIEGFGAISQGIRTPGRLNHLEKDNIKVYLK